MKGVGTVRILPQCPNRFRSVLINEDEQIRRPGRLISSRQIWLPTRPNAEPDMCDRCEELDKKIAHYRQIIARVLDPLLNERVGKMIEEMEAQKVTFHPEQ